MPLIVNNEEYPLYKIQGYNGHEEVVKMMKKSYDELFDRFWKHGKPVIFRIAKRYTFITKDGRKEGKKAIFIKWQEAVKTKKGGNATVIYCETVITEANGVKRYEPRGEAFRRKRVLHQEDAELAVFYHCISSVTSTGNSIYLEDLDAEEEMVAASREQTAAVDYYLYFPDSPLYNDRDKLVNIAYRWGVANAEKLSGATLRNRLSGILKNVNPSTDPELSIPEFINAVKQSSPLGDALIAVQRAMDNHGIVYKDFQWYIVSGNKNIKLFTVPPHHNTQAKRELAYFLMRTPEKYDQIKALAGVGEYEEEKGSVIPKGHEYSREELENLGWHELLNIGKELSVFEKGMKKPPLIDKILASQALEV